MPTVADVFMRLRIDRSQVKTDAEAGLKSVDTKGAGQRAGQQFSNEFGKRLNQDGQKHGDNFATQVAKGITLKRVGIGAAVTGALAVAPAAVAVAGAAIGVGFAAAAGAAIYKTLNTQVTDATKAATSAQKTLTTATSQQATAVKNHQLAVIALSNAEKSGNANAIAAAKVRLTAADQQLAKANQNVAADQKANATAQKALDLAKQQIAPYNAVKTALTGLKTTLIDVGNRALVGSGILTKMAQAVNQVGVWAKQHQGDFTAFFAASAPYIPIFVNFFERMVSTLLPMMTRLMTTSRPAVQAVLDAFVNFTKTGIGGFMAQMGSGAMISARAFGGLLVAISPLLPAIGQLSIIAANIVARFPALIPIFAGVVIGLKSLLIVSTVISAFQKITEVIKVLKEFELASKLAFLANPWVLLGVAVAAAAVLIITHWSQVSAFFVKAWHDIYSGFIGPLINWFTKSVPHAFSVAVSAITSVWGGITHFFSSSASAVTGAWGSVVRFFQGIGKSITGVFSSITSWVARNFDPWWAQNGQAIEAIWRGILAVAKAVWGQVTGVLKAAFNAVSAGAKGAWNLVATEFRDGVAIAKAIIGTLATVMKATWNVISAVFRAGAAVVGTVMRAGFTVVRDVAVTAFNVAVTAIRTAWALLEVVFKTGIGVVKALWQAAWTAIKAFATVAWAAVRTMLKIGWDLIVGIFTVAINLLTGHWSKAWQALRSMLTQIWNAMTSFLRVTLNAWDAVIHATWNAITTITRTIWNGISAFLHTWWNGVTGIFRTTLNGLKKIVSDAWTGIKNTTSSLWGGIKSVFDTFWRGLKQGFQSAVDAVKQIWAKLHDAALTPVKFVVGTVYNKGIVPVVDAIAGVVGLHPLNTVPGFAAGTPSGGAPRGWAWVGERGPELAYFHGGEHVLPHEQSMATGLPVPGFAAGTKPRLPGFADGTQPPLPLGASLGSLGDTSAQSGGDPTGIVKGLKAVGNEAVHLAATGISALRALAGDALAAGMNAILNPILNATPGTNTQLGKWIKQGIVQQETNMVNWIKGASSGAVGSGSGSSVAAYAKTFATGLNHPYVTGGAGPNGWDCSGFTAYVYDHFGYFPGKQGQRYGTSESQWADTTHLQASGAVPGALAFFDGSGYAPPGHVGVVINPQQYVSAYDHASGTVVRNINGSAGRVWGFRIPKGGFKSAAGSAAAVGGSAGSVQALVKSMAAARGWTGVLWNDLNALEMAEAGWNLNARNPTSGAYGIAQFINGPSEYALYGGNSATAQGQGTAFLNYIAQRYGSPAGAWAHEQANHWYSGGGTVSEPVFGIGKYSGDRYMFGEQGSERVVPRASDPLLDEIRRMRAELTALAPKIAVGTALAMKAPKGQEAQAARQGSRL